MGINFNKITEAVKKALENTNKVTQENEGKTYEKPSETYDSNIFTGTKENWTKLGTGEDSNEIITSLTEQGYNIEDIHTLIDSDQDGTISAEEIGEIASLDGENGISAEDVDKYLEELSRIDVNSLGNTEEDWQEIGKDSDIDGVKVTCKNGQMKYEFDDGTTI